MTSVQEKPAPPSDPPPPPAPAHEIRIQSALDGDTRLNWDSDDPVSTGIAKAAFDDAKAKGFWAYRVDKKGNAKQSEVIREFDPKAEAIILGPQLAGG